MIDADSINKRNRYHLRKLSAVRRGQAFFTNWDFSFMGPTPSTLQSIS